jgi:mannose-6-phosphate isomerase
MPNYIEERPWGSFEILCDEDYTKVKKITVKPGGILSYQYHFKRNETWIVVKGEGVVKINGIESTKKYGNIITISAFDNHRIRNEKEEDLVFIEIQTGEYFGEDDIVRLEDEYDRK